MRAFRLGVTDGKLTTYDRLYAFLGERLGKFERPEQIVRVGYRDCRKAARFCQLGHCLDRNCPFEE